MAYTHLTQEERYKISSLMEAGFSQNTIAERLGRSASTISRELGRNRGARGYRPEHAHRTAQARASACRSHPRYSYRDWQVVATLLR